MLGGGGEVHLRNVEKQNFRFTKRDYAHFLLAKRDYVDFCYSKLNKKKIEIFCSAKQQNSNETAVSFVFFRIQRNIYFRKIKTLLGMYRHNYVICAIVI